MGLACSLLSVFVVLRRWAFIGEGIAHAGFGGAGTAWLLAILLSASLSPSAIYLIAILFCFAVALAIGYFTRREALHADTAIGIFLVASLAWGFIAQSVYKARFHASPPDFETYLTGDPQSLPAIYALVAIICCAAVVAIVWLLGKEILYYCFDPTLAEVSGVRVGFIHYLLIFLSTLTIIIGMRVVGPLLMTALLVLPGASALQISRNIRTVIIASLGVGLIASVGGPSIHHHFSYIPPGPAIVLLLVAEFLAIYVWRKLGQAVRL